MGGEARTGHTEPMVPAAPHHLSALRWFVAISRPETINSAPSSAEKHPMGGDETR
jgi:hypothetical protein